MNNDQESCCGEDVSFSTTENYIVVSTNTYAHLRVVVQYDGNTSDKFIVRMLESEKDEDVIEPIHCNNLEKTFKMFATCLHAKPASQP